MNFKKITILLLVLLVADQALKIWIKTHMTLDEAIMVVPTWFQLRFIENNGAAFGMRLATGGAFDWGKLALSLFRLAMIGLLGYYLRYLGKRKTPAGVLVGLTLILAGAIGNMIDSAFYGLIFSASTPTEVAHFGGSYAPLMMGRVVDMFYSRSSSGTACRAGCRFWSTAATTFSAPSSTWPTPTSRWQWSIC